LNSSIRWLIPIILVLFFLQYSVLGRVDENTLKARILYLGDASFPPNKLILQWILAEPKFSMVIVPCDTYFISLPEAKKLTRLYLPRSYESLNSTQDIVIIHNISPTIIPRKVLDFIQRLVDEEGLGIGLISFFFWGGGAGTNDIEVWMTLRFYDLFPADVDTLRDIPAQFGRTFWSVVKDYPILGLPDIEKQPMQGFGNHGGDIMPRPGAQIHAVWNGRNTPVLVTGTYGSGRTLQLSQGWHNPPDSVFQNYRYMPDLHYNQLYFLAGVDPPADIELAHRARELFIDVRIRKSVTISAMEFVDKFGARLDEIERELASLTPQVLNAERRYLEGDFQTAQTILLEVIGTYPEIEERITRLKNRTMMWIYISEWLIVSSTGTICGVIVWTLMVKRRLYRDVDSTRLTTSAEN
jgi:hypothetical protein